MSLLLPTIVRTQFKTEAHHIGRQHAVTLGIALRKQIGDDAETKQFLHAVFDKLEQVLTTVVMIAYTNLGPPFGCRSHYPQGIFD